MKIQTPPAEYPPTPELDKMHAVKIRSQTIGEFLDWLTNEKNWTLCEEHEHTDDCCGDNSYTVCGIGDGAYFPARYGTEKLLAEFFDINLQKVDDEKRAILEHVRSQN